DLPALCKTVGFAHHSSSHFCSFCPLPKKDINNIDRESWSPPRSWSEHLRIAQDWKDAVTEAARNKIFQEHGLRWSELLRLPYWDPTKFALIDTMHNLFLGELHHHCITIWGLKTAEGRAKKQRGTRVASHSPEMQQALLNRVVAGLRSGSMSTIAAIRKDYLEAITLFNSISIPPSSTKLHYATILQRWHFHVAHGPQLAEERLSQSVFSGVVLDAIRADIQALYMPSWLPKPPRRFGNASHGKLSADQWRTACTVNMVIMLGRLWGVTSATDEEKKALENFMHLVAAVDLATRRSMTVQRAERFDHHIIQYLRGLQSLYNASLVPNHHLSLHLIECLILFGPTHAWWAFPFERYNGLLQRL
ncbi:hypothetical protein C8Q78DRAFT_933152, partial [Trametes maxima]